MPTRLRSRGGHRTRCFNYDGHAFEDRWRLSKTMERFNDDGYVQRGIETFKGKGGGLSMR